MLSDNIIDRHQALSDLLSLNFINVYVIAVAALLLVCWRIKDWL